MKLDKTKIQIFASFVFKILEIILLIFISAGLIICLVGVIREICLFFSHNTSFSGSSLSSYSVGIVGSCLTALLVFRNFANKRDNVSELTKKVHDEFLSFSSFSDTAFATVFCAAVNHSFPTTIVESKGSFSAVFSLSSPTNAQFQQVVIEQLLKQAVSASSKFSTSEIDACQLYLLKRPLTPQQISLVNEVLNRCQNFVISGFNRFESIIMGINQNMYSSAQLVDVCNYIWETYKNGLAYLQFANLNKGFDSIGRFFAKNGKLFII
jgi:hypothetical protein